MSKTERAHMHNDMYPPSHPSVVVLMHAEERLQLMQEALLDGPLFEDPLERHLARKSAK